MQPKIDRQDGTGALSLDIAEKFFADEQAIV